MTENDIEAVKNALKQGNKKRAREILRTIIHSNPNDDQAWIYCALATDTRRASIGCLRRALDINPRNEQAQGLLSNLEKTITSHAVETPPRISKGEASSKQAGYSEGKDGADERMVDSDPSQHSREMNDQKQTESDTSDLSESTGEDPTIASSAKQTSMNWSLLLQLLGLALILILGTLLGRRIALSTASNSDQDELSEYEKAIANDTKEDWTEYLIPVPAGMLKKSPDLHEGDRIHFAGTVFTIYEESEGTVMQLWVYDGSGSYNDVEAVTVLYPGRLPGVYEDSRVEIWGYASGIVEGTNAFGGSVRQPLIVAKFAEECDYCGRTPSGP
jgi:tetratricopeptide (TPR) repeat protein